MVDAAVLADAPRAPVEGGLTRRAYLRRGKELEKYGVSEKCKGVYGRNSAQGEARFCLQEAVLW